jgi:NAD(P)H dehydrogenase (quinone)
MFAVTGITGKVGGEAARALLAGGLPVRAVLRDAKKASTWRDRGCHVAVANMDDAAALASAFNGAHGVFVLLPPVFDPAPGFPEARATVTALALALKTSRPAKVVCLSTIGAQATRLNLLTQLSIMEQVLGELPVPVAFLRPAWFMENSSSDVAPARLTGVIPSFLQPLDKPVPMVSATDVGRVAAQLLQESWTGRRVVELEGPHRVTPNEIAVVFSSLLGSPVRAQAVPRGDWEDLFKSQGMRHPTPRIQMLDGFNQGWIAFENKEAGPIKGTVALQSALQAMISGAEAARSESRGGQWWRFNNCA